MARPIVAFRPFVARSMIDVHQHLWPPTLFDALRARRRPPCLSGEMLKLDGEPEFRVDPRAHDQDLRAAQAADDGLALALVSLSSRGIGPVGRPVARSRAAR